LAKIDFEVSTTAILPQFYIGTINTWWSVSCLLWSETVKSIWQCEFYQVKTIFETAKSFHYEIWDKAVEGFLRGPSHKNNS